MTKEQFEHYIKGGKFMATYDPVVIHDLSADNRYQRKNRMVIAQNMIVSPLQYEQYKGQHAFNGESIYGWSPEQDFKDLEIINDFLDSPEPLPQYMYQLVYTDMSKLEANFGKGYEGRTKPLYAFREYFKEMDDYILKLSDPQADDILKYVWQGKYQEEIKWKSILKN